MCNTSSPLLVNVPLITLFLTVCLLLTPNLSHQNPSRNDYNIHPKASNVPLSLWEPNYNEQIVTRSGTPIQAFKQIMYPIDIYYRLPIIGNYPLLVPHLGTPMFDLCDPSRWSSLLHNDRQFDYIQYLISHHHHYHSSKNQHNDGSDERFVPLFSNVSFIYSMCFSKFCNINETLNQQEDVTLLQNQNHIQHDQHYGKDDINRNDFIYQMMDDDNTLYHNRISHQLIRQWGKWNESERIIHVMMNNFCYYCLDISLSSSSTSLSSSSSSSSRSANSVSSSISLDSSISSLDLKNQFIEFHNSLENHSCPYFFPILQHHCGDNQTGHPLLSDLLVMRMQGDPFMCYCKGHQKYGYMCDAYTLFFNDFNIFVKNWIYFAIMSAINVIFFMIVVLPGIVGSLRQKGKKRRTKTDKCMSLFGLRMQSAFYIYLSQICIIWEEIWSQVEVISAFSFLPHHILYGGLFRMITMMLIGLGYASMLVLWSKIVNKVITISKGFDWKVILLLVGLYSSILFFGFIILILTITLVPPAYIYAAMGICALAYFIIFPIGFCILGTYMCIILKRSGKNAAEYRTTRFVLIANTVIIIGFISMFLVVLGYVIGWDYPGFLLGTYRNIFIDNTIVTLYIPMTYILCEGIEVQYFYSKLFCRKTEDDND